jgi:hypothetical protein
MLVRQLLVASLLAVTAVAAMSQEIDRSETLQARSLAWTAEHSAPATGRTRESVVAETRNLQAQGAIKVGEKADGPSVDAVTGTAYAQGKTATQTQAALPQPVRK